MSKEQFENWLLKDDSCRLANGEVLFKHFGFNRYPFEMQIGVYLAYYDSLGIDIMVDVLINDDNEKRFTCWILEDCIESCENIDECTGVFIAKNQNNNLNCKGVRGQPANCTKLCGYTSYLKDNAN